MHDITYLVQLGVPNALLSAFFMLLGYKLGVVEWVQIHAPKIISSLFSCAFCLSFWVNLTVGFVVITPDTALLIIATILIAILSTPITLLCISHT